MVSQASSKIRTAVNVAKVATAGMTAVAGIATKSSAATTGRTARRVWAVMALNQTLARRNIAAPPKRATPATGERGSEPIGLKVSGLFEFLLQTQRHEHDASDHRQMKVAVGGLSDYNSVMSSSPCEPVLGAAATTSKYAHHMLAVTESPRRLAPMTGHEMGTSLTPTPSAAIDSPSATMTMSPCRSAKCRGERSRQPGVADQQGAAVVDDDDRGPESHLGGAIERGRPISSSAVEPTACRRMGDLPTKAGIVAAYDGEKHKVERSNPDIVQLRIWSARAARLACRGMPPGWTKL